MSDWARECRDKWLMSYALDDQDGHLPAAKAAIEGAIREALAKAAEVADEHRDCCTPRNIPGLIRALGAAKEAK